VDSNKGFSVGVVIVIVVSVCIVGGIVGFATGLFMGSAAMSYKPTEVQEQVAAQFTLVVNTNAPLPTYTFYPTYTPIPPSDAIVTISPPQSSTIATVEATSQTSASSLPTDQTSDPIKFTGQGDSVLDVNNLDSGVLHIVGNSASRIFSIETISSAGETIDLLVLTSDPYDGYRPFYWLEGEKPARLKISANGPWEITYSTLLEGPHPLVIPGKYQGIGDDVLILTGGIPDVATITGNSEGRIFSVNTYGDGQDLLVLTSDPYQGTVLIPPGTVFLEVVAAGQWSVEITAK
jgi:hypothetical protein